MFSIDLRECTPDTNTRSELVAAKSTLPYIADRNYTCHRNDPYKENYQNGHYGRQNVLTRRYKTDLKLNKQVKWMHTSSCGMLGSKL
jgi:hypothetical protein